jgi:hypothetical protein
MIKAVHNAGFFSCCNIKLRVIIEYFNENRILPIKVDCSELFDLYKLPSLRHSDITHHFFEIHEESIPFYERISVTQDTREDQFSDYRLLNVESLRPFIHTYFSPIKEIQAIQQQLLIKYNIDLSNCIGIYYRGTDKYGETQLGDFEKYSEQLLKLQQTGKQIIVQTDSANFLEYMKLWHPSIITVQENRVSKTNNGIHNESSRTANYTDIKYLFATFLLLSQCDQLIVSSGNCSLWIMYYRGHVRNVYQCLDNIFL